MPEKILLVDDYPENLILLEEVFLRAGIETIRAETGYSAIELAQKHKPDLILLDVMMPGINGFEVSVTLKENPLTTEIPIIFLTALSDNNSVLKSFASGGVDYINKPFNEAELLARVYTHLELKRQKETIKRQVIQLEQREKDLIKIFEQSNDPVLITSKKGNILEANKKACEMLEYSRQELKALNVSAIINKNYPIIREEIIDDIYKKGNMMFETENISKTGRAIPVEISSSIINFFGEDVILSTCRDQTERKKSEKALIESEEKFRSFFENNTAIMLQLETKNKKIINYNKAAEKFYGFTKDEFLSKTIYDINQLPRQEIDNLMKIAIAKDSNFFRFNHKIASGQIRRVELSASPVKTSEGVLMFLIINDITELAQAEEKIRKLSTAVEQSANAIIITDTNGSIEYVNPKFVEITGYSYEEAVGQNPKILNSGENTPQFYKNMWDTILAGNIWRGEFHNKNKFGKMFWEWATITPIKDENDKIVNFLAVKEDITDRKSIEAELELQYKNLLDAKKIAEENEEKFRAIFDNTADSITAVEKAPGQNGKYIMVNKNAIETYGYTQEEFYNMTPVDLINNNSDNKYKERIEFIDKNTSARFETEHITKHGKIIPVEINAKKIKLNNKDVFLAIIRDISERKQMQQKILSTIIETEEKERERIAQDLHDGLGPLMSTIKLYVQWLTKPDLKADRTELAKKAEETIEIAYVALRNIANNLSPHILKNFGLVSALKSFTDRVKELNFIDIDITSNTNRRFDNITETVLYRVLIESINNSIKHSKADKISISINQTDNELYVKYFDTGIGFDVDKTMKQKSTGMGLFNITNRINSIGGQIEINSKPGKGTEINIKIII